MEEKNKDIEPFTFKIDMDRGAMTDPDNHITRRLSSMRNQYRDSEAYEKMLQGKDILLYEVYEKLVPEISGELIQGLSIVHPGKVGNEYFMTKGHFHSILKTAEIYFCIKGHGYMMMETQEGKWAARELTPNTVLYVPGGWAHRSINVGDSDLITWFIYPADAGHDYSAIKEKGFRKLMVENNGKLEIIDNPRRR